jgi:hypothetical protein
MFKNEVLLNSFKESLSLSVIDLTFHLIFPASLLKGLKHANIVLLHDIVHTKETLTFVFEYMVSSQAFYKPGACMIIP